MQIRPLYDAESWGSYNLDITRVRKDEFIHVHGVHEGGQKFSWDQNPWSAPQPPISSGVAAPAP